MKRYKIQYFFLCCLFIFAQPLWAQIDTLNGNQENFQQSLEAETEAAIEAAKEETKQNTMLFNIKKAKIDSLKKSITDYHALINNSFKNKESRTIANSYESIIVNCNILVSDFSDKYLAELEEYLKFQKHLYLNFVQSSIINNIVQKGNLIISSSETDFKFISKEYTKFYKTRDLTPYFSTLSEYYKYYNHLDEILKFQNIFLSIIDKEKKIQENQYQITSSCYQKDILKGYNNVKKDVLLSTEFLTLENGKKVLEMLDNFIALQGKFVIVIGIRKQIEKNDNSIYTDSKSIKNIIKAYGIVYSSFALTPSFRTIEQSDKYISQLNELIKYQDRFLLVKIAPSVKKINQDLRNAKTVGAIHNIIFQ